jgi:hypothetical protein
MSYIAYICYRHTYDDDNELIDEATEICFEQPDKWKYSQVIPIQFSPLMSWDEHKDKKLWKPT